MRSGWEWGAVFREIGDIPRAIAIRSRGDAIDPEDAVQEAWLALASRIGRYRPGDGGDLRAWSAAVVRNRLANLRRRAAGRPEVPLNPDDAMDLPGRDEDPARACERHESREGVRAALSEARVRLPETSSRVVFLMWVEGRTVAEAASSLGLSAAQVRDRRRRSLPILRAVLSRRFGADAALLAQEFGEERS